MLTNWGCLREEDVVSVFKSVFGITSVNNDTRTGVAKVRMAQQLITVYGQLIQLSPTRV